MLFQKDDRCSPDDSFVQELYELITSSGYKLSKSDDPIKVLKKRFKASCIWNQQNRFDEVHPNWSVAQTPYGTAYCDEPLRDETGQIVVRFDFNEAVALAESNHYEAITKTTTGYRMCKNSIPIAAPKSKPGQCIMVWTKKSDFVFPNDRTICVANKRIAKKSYAENQLAFSEFIIATQKASINTSSVEPVARVEPAPVARVSTDEELVVEEVVIDGKTYYQDDGDVLWDPENGNEVGTLANVLRESQKQAEIRKKNAIGIIKKTTKKIIEENNITNKHQLNKYCNGHSNGTSRTKIYRVVQQNCREAWNLLGTKHSEQFCGSQFRCMLKGFSEYKD